MYGFKMSLFDIGKPDELLLFVINFKMTLNSSRTLASNVNIWYILNILCGGSLSQFDTFMINFKCDHSTFKSGRFGFRYIFFYCEHNV